jgi:phage shock protein A
VREERRLRDRCANHEREADQLVRSAELAVRKGEDDLAREALRRRRQHLALARTASEQWEAERRTLEELQGNLAILETKIEQARRQKEALLAQQRLARVRRELQENAGIRRSSATDRTLGRLTDDIDELEAESSAYAELAVRDVRTQVAHMDVIKAQDESDIESELEGLKQRMKKTP